MTTAQAASINWAWRSLAFELPGEDRDELHDRAETLVAIAEHLERPVEELIEWIHNAAPEKEWTALEFRSYCAATPRPER